MAEHSVPTLSLELEEPIIRADAFERVRSADAYVKAMNERAAAILADAERVFTERSAAGFEKGFKSGRSEALAALVHLHETAAGLSKAFEAEAQGLVLQATSRIIGELPDHEVVERIVAASLGDFRGHRELRILVPIRLVERVRGQILTIAARTLPNSIVYIVGDATLEQRECLIESEQGFLKLDIETLVEGLARALDTATSTSGLEQVYLQSHVPTPK